MKRIAIFAHFDKENLIEDYVVHYLTELKKVTENIIFVSDSDIYDSELLKIKKIVKFSIIGKHGEYDFGSYKRGVLWAMENLNLNNYEELILCNDSCYAPLYPFELMFKKMSCQNLDFWGATENPVGLVLNSDNEYKTSYIKHIQSYFVVFKPQIFLSKCFENFMLSIKQEKCKEQIIINYEQGLTQLLLKFGYKYDVYCNSSKKNKNSHIEFYENLIKNDKIPFVKTSIFRSNNLRKFTPNYKIINTLTNYDIKLIKKDVRRNKYKMKINDIIASLFSLHNSNGYKTLTILFINFKLYKKRQAIL